MAIDINSLFADIIDTPEQRQQKLLQQGMVQGQLLSSGLRGRAAALAPLAQMAGQLGVQRQENLRRAVQPMLGIDPRTTGEKLQEQLGKIDTSTPQGLLKAAQAVQQIDPIRAAALRQAAAELTRQKQQDLLAQQQASTSIARDLEAINASQESRRIAAQTAQNENLTNTARVNAAASIVSSQDPSFASLMPLMYMNDPEGANSVAEKYLAGESEGSLRSQKIQSYTDMLMKGGEFETIAEARDYATKIADNKVQIIPDPTNPTRATFTDLVTQEVRTISSLPSMPSPQEGTQAFDDYLTQLDGVSVSEMLNDTTGTFQMAAEAFGRIAEGITGLEGLTDERRTQYKTSLKQLENLTVRAFALNPKFLGGEQERIREEMALKPEFLLGKEGAAARIASIDNFLDEELKIIQSRINNPETDRDQRSADLTTKSNIIALKQRLYPQKPAIRTLTSDVINNMSKSRLKSLVQYEYSDDELDSLSPELVQIISKKLQGQ